MRRAVPILRSLAILAVVLNHANWHVLSEFAAGEGAGYPFVILDQVGKMAIPAFMFIAGYFIAYATSGGKRDLSWSIISARIKGLLWPWLIWSTIMMIGQFFQGHPISLVEFLRTLVIHYYFVPLLLLYYLLAPFVVRWAKSDTRLLLVGAATVQLLAMVLFYARVYHPGWPGKLDPWIDLGPLQYLRFAFYFPFGIVYGMFSRVIKDSLVRFKSILPWLVLLLFGLSVVETAIAYNIGGEPWPQGGDQTKLSSALFSTAFLLCFIVWDKLTVPFHRTISKLGTHSYGLYLCHYPILGIVARIIGYVTPGIAAQGGLFLSILFVLTIGFSMLLIEGTARLPTKRFYRYLFG